MLQAGGANVATMVVLVLASTTMNLLVVILVLSKMCQLICI